MRTNPASAALPPGLWDHESVQHALAVRDIGAVFRHFRQYTGESQTSIGSRVGLAQPDVSTIERGHRLVQSVEVLTRIAAGLQIPPSSLGLATAAADTMRTSTPAVLHMAARVTEASAEEDDVRRRDLMTGALGIGAGFAVGPGPATAAASGDPTASLERSLFEPSAAPPASLAELRATLAGARAEFADARYSALGRGLPMLLASSEATRDTTSGHQREQAQAVVARAYVLATELAVKQHSEMAWATADRALTAARASGDPQPIAEAARVLAITMRRAGRSRAAVDFLATTAASLEVDKRVPLAEILAARVCLLLTAAYTAASGGHRSGALDLLNEAEEDASRIRAGGRPAGLFTILASPAECAMYRISTYNALSTPDDGVPYADRVNPSRLANTERVARYLTDVARMWHQLGDGRRAFGALRAIEQAAPEEVRRPALRTLTLDLLYSPQSLPDLRSFATRTGALAAS